jgi:hypothetical protein
MHRTKRIRSAAAIVALLGATFLSGTAGCQRGGDPGPVADATQVAAIREALHAEAGAGGAAAAPVGTGWATLKGVFKFAGDPPQMPPYDVTKDEAVCKPGGVAPPQELLVVDPGTSGIANIAIFPRTVSRVHESAEPGTEPLVFDQKACVFLSHVMGLTINTPIEIKNSDPPPVGHNTKIEGRQNTFNQTIPPGEQLVWTAKREEAMPIRVRCTMHPWMAAYMLPRKTKYYAVTAPDGTFEIANLPAGEELQIQVWHESAAGAQQALVVDTDAAKELDWDGKGRFSITLEEDEVREIEIVVPAAAFRGM